MCLALRICPGHASAAFCRSGMANMVKADEWLSNRKGFGLTIASVLMFLHSSCLTDMAAAELLPL